jgi:hypothetical protein
MGMMAVGAAGEARVRIFTAIYSNCQKRLLQNFSLTTIVILSEAKNLVFSEG